MTTTITSTVQLNGDHWLVTLDVTAGGTLPQDIFIYENTGTSVLGNYYGTCSLSELTRYQTFTGTPIPLFGNRFVKYTQAKIVVDLGRDPNQVVATCIANITALSKAYTSQGTTTQTFIIP